MPGAVDYSLFSPRHVFSMRANVCEKTNVNEVVKVLEDKGTHKEVISKTGEYFFTAVIKRVLDIYRHQSFINAAYMNLNFTSRTETLQGWRLLPDLSCLWFFKKTGCFFYYFLHRLLFLFSKFCWHLENQ